MSAVRSSSIVSKVSTHSRFSFKVPMKRSATPLPSGSRTKEGEASKRPWLVTIVVSPFLVASTSAPHSTERQATAGVIRPPFLVAALLKPALTNLRDNENRGPLQTATSVG